jgi:hypothetical protein
VMVPAGNGNGQWFSSSCIGTETRLFPAGATFISSVCQAAGCQYRLVCSALYPVPFRWCSLLLIAW